jgi:hypothetical protein
MVGDVSVPDTQAAAQPPGALALKWNAVLRIGGVGEAEGAGIICRGPMLTCAWRTRRRPKHNHADDVADGVDCDLSSSSEDSRRSISLSTRSLGSSFSERFFHHFLAILTLCFEPGTSSVYKVKRLMR